MTDSCFDTQDLQYAWDSTSLGWAEACLRKYQYYMIDGWYPLGGSPHLEFGMHYATALEHYHKHRAAGLTYDEAVIEVVHEALINTWEDCLGCAQGIRYDSDATPTQCLTCKGAGGRPIDWQHNIKTRANLIRTIVWYCDQFKDDPCSTVILGDGRAATEYSFSLELDKDILYCGHIDRLVEYSGDVYVQDQKTTSGTLSPHYFRQFSPHTQMSGYTYAGKVIYNIKVKGVMIDAAQIAIGFSRFERGFTFRTDQQLDEWRTDTLHHIERARRATAEGYFPQNRSSCDKFGGCEFRGVCSLSPEVRENFLRADFKKGKNWNPLARR